MIPLLRSGAAALALALASLAASAQTPVPARPVPPAEAGIRWKDLSPSQRTALAPLEHEWSGIDAQRKQKWVELSGPIGRMSSEERGRIQARMADWARMTPAERGRTRLNFEEAKQVPSQDRQARWAAYQALDPEQKRALAARAAAPAADARRTEPRPETKSNIVPNPAYAAPPRPIGPTVLQAQPGATTTLISRRPAPPPHQQTGMPKIAATPGFVNKSTLLPQRGPQGAAAARMPPQAGNDAAKK
ncbi:MAG: DUF3106 domain-containing protein [Proteobacteria bacterium]|nr:DUF3106 domain-containing protein [Pseudomonadota bacterium]